VTTTTTTGESLKPGGDRAGVAGADAPRRRLAAFAGIVAAMAAIGSSELVAGLLPGAPSLVLAVGQAVIDAQPPGAKDVAVALFGTADKLAFEILILAVALAIAAGLGILALRRPGIASAAFVAFALVGFAAAATDASTSAPLAALVAGVAAVGGSQTLGWLVGRIRAATAEGTDPNALGMPDWGRRRLLLQGGALAVTAVAAGAVGRLLLERQRAAPAAADARIPRPEPVAPPPAGAELAVAGITPLVVPNDDFYRIDTALIPPVVDLDTWRLRIHGLVDRETTLTFDELVALGTFEQYVTIACVSNEVGGDLVGNAKWAGVRLRDVLDLAGVQASATQLVGRSVDGFTAGMPTAWIMDASREPMIAVTMNDVALPIAHGFPARLIVPGLYGYVSATKWLSELELTTLEGFDAFWIPRGWAKEAPILTQSRIDVPRNRTRVAAGRSVIAGVAWAPDRGVNAVEVAVDDGEWRPATLSTPISDATWVQWRVDWDAALGEHRIAVRATDGNGEVQTASVSPPAPDGARGHHSITVTVIQA
jgi:DMSO/TMAO reductase YedYZ molybdopterin-dependent catalytic subunit